MTWQRICDRRHRVLRTGDTLIVWLGGTTGHSEWARNLRTRTVREYDRRVKAELWAEAITVGDEIESMLGGVQTVVVAGFSRGGGLAQVVALEAISKVLGVRVLVRLYAPKRALSDVRGVPVIHCSAHRGDIVPYLPPWYARLGVTWMGRFDWLWKAHDKSGHDAARWRHEVSRG